MEINPQILSGKPVIGNIRIPVYLIIELISAGYDFDKIIKAYPTLTKKDIQAAIAYAARLTRKDGV